MSSLRPKIGIVSVDGIPPRGGMGRYVQILRDGLRIRGYEVSVFDSSKRSFATSVLRNVGFSLCLGGALSKWVRRECIDLLHVHTGPGGVLLSCALSVPTIVTVHHTYTSQSDVPGQYWKRLLVPWERKTISLASSVIAVSEDTKKILISQYGIEESDVVVIPPGLELQRWIDQDRELPMREAHSLVFVGRKGARKGLDTLLVALGHVRKVAPQTHLSVVGVEDTSSRAVSYLGHISDQALSRLLGSSRCVVCPSLLEGFGIVAIEALAAGTPVVANDVLGLRNVIQHECTGLLTKPGDSLDLAHAIIRMLKDDALWKQCHEGARKVRSSFDADSTIDAHIHLYHRVYSKPC